MWSKKSMAWCAGVLYNEWPKIKKLTLFGNGKVKGFWKYQSCWFCAIFGNFRAFGVKLAIIKKRKNFTAILSNFCFTTMAMFTPNVLKLPKIVQNRHEWYFQNPMTLPFPKKVDFLIFDHLLYSTPAHNSIDFFDHIPFWDYWCLMLT